MFHIYMTGLGPVRGQVQTGVPAPLDSIIPIDGEIRCRFSPYTADAETLVALDDPISLLLTVD